MIEINGLVKEYITMEKSVKASDNISFKFEDKGLYFVLGKSGCGKTTLLNILSGLDSYDSGEVIVNGCNISKISEKELDEYRNIHIGIVFQDYNLVSDLNVYDNLCIVLRLQNKTGEKEEIKRVLHSVGLEGYEKRKISQLSGGERQRIAIARCLLKETDILFADEPTGNLDKKTGENILALLKEISKERLVIIVSHDRESAYKYGDIIINMSDGKIIGQCEGRERECLYSFDIGSNPNTRTHFDNLDINKVLEVIGEYINNSSKEDEFQICNISKTYEIADDVDAKCRKQQDKKIASQSKLSCLYKSKLSLLFLRKRIVRFIFTTVLLALSCVMFYFSIYISFYDENSIILKYMEENKPLVFSVYSNCSYEDDFYKIVDNQVLKGERLDNIMSDKFEDFVKTNRYIVDETFESDGCSMYSATIFFASDIKGYPELKEGNIPESCREIVISDYLAYVLNVRIGDEIEYVKSKFVVSGIYETDYVQAEVKRKLNYGYDEPFFTFNCMYKYFAAYVDKEFLNKYKENVKNIGIKSSNFLLSKYENRYLSSNLDVADVSVINENELLEGRMPQADNEVVISEGFAINNDLINGAYIGKNYKFKDIHKDSYNGTYSDSLNMYEYFTEGIKIVGIVADSLEEMRYDLYIPDSKWSKVISDYYDYYYGEYAVMADDRFYEEIINVSQETGVLLNEPAVNNIMKFNETIESIKPILILILVITMGINFILIGTFISISINENKKNLGILRSLGVRMKDCTNIFSLEFVIIFVSSMLLIVPCILAIISMANGMYMAELTEVKYCIIDMNYIAFMLMLLVEILVNMVSVSIPINRIRKKKPIEIINDL